METSDTDIRIDELGDRVGRFEGNVKERFDKIDREFAKVDRRFDRFEDKIEARFRRWDKIVSGGVVTIIGAVVAKVLGVA